MTKTIYLRGEGGGVFAFDLPLPEPIADRVAKGQLHQVTDDGKPWVEPDPELPLDEGAVVADEHTLEQLKEMAAELELPTSGTKAELAERINTKLAETGD